jgi:DNA-binding response OmpR family regulator
MSSTSGTVAVLLVEDEPAVRQVSARVLRAAGYHVLEAADGEAALAVARAHPGPIALVISDITMPKLGGREMAGQLLRERPALRFLFTSGFSGSDVAAGPELGAPAEFLQKPYTTSELRNRVVDLLGRMGEGA